MMYQVLRSAALAATLALGMGGAAQAATVDFRIFEAGENLGLTTLATLSATQVGTAVQFVLTNTTSGQPQSFISQLLLTYTGDLTNVSRTNVSGVASDSFDKQKAGKPITNAGLKFQFDIGWPTKNSTPTRLTPTKSSTFTLLNTTLAGFFAGNDFAMIHVQGLNNGGSTKYVAIPTPQVPLPAGLPLLGLGLGALALLRRRKA